MVVMTEIESGYTTRRTRAWRREESEDVRDRSPGRASDRASECVRTQWYQCSEGPQYRIRGLHEVLGSVCKQQSYQDEFCASV